MIDLRNEFPQSEAIVYLNHAGVGPWPKRTQDAINRFTAENIETGAQHYPHWLKTQNNLRQRIARLINAPNADDIALVKNTSEGLSMVAYGLQWQAGDSVVISNHEFPSNRIVWESLSRFGVEVRTADLDSASTPEEAVIAAIDKTTRLVSISSVHYASGLKMDCVRLGQACREMGVLFCIDAIQSVGVHSFDVQTYQADFAIADGHKWMLGPEGLGFFYSRPEAREQLSLNQFGWHMVEDKGNYDRHDWEVAESARRFECGSPNMLGIHALDASLSLFEELGMETIGAELEARIAWLHEALFELPGIAILSPADALRRGGIVTFQVANQDNHSLQRKLQSQGIICAYRGGGIRFTPHFYTPMKKLENAVEQVKNIIV